jgi:hypothetical protein
MDDYLPECQVLDASPDIERCFASDIQTSSHFSPYHSVGLYNFMKAATYLTILKTQAVIISSTIIMFSVLKFILNCIKGRNYGYKIYAYSKQKGGL